MAIARLQIYKCAVCGNIVEVVTAGGGHLTCCDQAMGWVEENTTDAAYEKHVPVVKKVAGGYHIEVGEVLHPMEDKHFIEWIELVTGDGIAYRQYLKPGQPPSAKFETNATGVTVREYCNLHGMWRK